MRIPERMLRVHCLIHSRNLSVTIIIFGDVQILFIKFYEFTAVSADRKTAVQLYETMNRHSTFFSGCNCIDCKFRSGVYITMPIVITAAWLIGTAVCYQQDKKRAFLSATLREG